MITPSKAHMIDLCLYALRDDVPRKVEGTVHPRATLGTLVHHANHAAVIFGSDTPPEIDDPEARGMAYQALAFVTDRKPPTLSEAGFLYDTRNDTCVLGPARGEPGYDTAPPGCVRGTWDLVWYGLNGNGELCASVYDLKTGKFDGAHEEQLSMQALQHRGCSRSPWCTSRFFSSAKRSTSRRVSAPCSLTTSTPKQGACIALCVSCRWRNLRRETIATGAT